MKGDVSVSGGAFVNGNGNVDALRPWLFPDLVVLLQDSHAFGRNVDAEAGNGAGRKEVISGLGSGKGGLGQAPESEEDYECQRLFHFRYLDGNDPQFADVEPANQCSHMEYYTCSGP